MKLNSLSHIFIPAIIRTLAEQKQTIRQHADVTVMYCEIADFHKVVEMYPQGIELIDLMEQLQSVIDMLCEQHGLTKIEQVSKQFTIVGGLKVDYSQLEKPNQSNHHSVRVLDFAVAL